MKILMLLCLIWMFPLSIAAQDVPIPIEAEVTRLYDVETPPFYVRGDIPVKWSADGSMFAVRFDHRGRDREWVDILWRVYDTASGEMLYSFKNTRPYLQNTQTGEEHYFTLNFEGRGNEAVILTLDTENSVRIYDAATSELQFSMDDVTGFPLYSPDGQQFLIDTTSDDVLRIYNTSDFTLQYSVDDFRAYQWSPDSTALIVFSPTVETAPFEAVPHFIWNPAENVLIALEQKTDRLLWSDDSKSLVSRSVNNNIEIYDANTGKLTNTIDSFTYDRVSPLLLTQKYLVLANHGAHYSTTMMLNIWNRHRKAFIFSVEVTGGVEIHLEEDELRLLEPLSGLRHITLDDESEIEMTEFESPERMHFVSPNWQWFVMEPVTWSHDSQHFAAYAGNYYKVSIWQVIEPEK